MKDKLFPSIIALAALLVSGSAAFYSVFGLSKLFAGASTEVLIMAGSLEFAKLVVASLLYQYWATINKILRTYLAVAVFVLMVITSGGIYGFLSGAYQETATKSEFLDKSLLVLQTKQNRFEENKTDLTLEKTQLNTTITDLRTSLSNPAQVSYYSEEAGQVITTTSSSTRKALQKELDATIVDRNNLNIKLEAVQDSIMRLDTELLDLEINNEEQRELGPLKYLAETTGKDMGQVVNWFLLLIIFVFDPLAIAMVVAANFAFSQIKPKTIARKDVEYGNSIWPGKPKIQSSLEKNVENVVQKENIDISIIDRLEKMEAYDREVDEKLKTISDFEEKINNLSGVISGLVNNAKNYKIYGENKKK
tara:strand:+ start:438 stop:1529 length:1092 start_codon:yes stop_codon:yes gene_type:complete